jgi:hypothetical protein
MATMHVPGHDRDAQLVVPAESIVVLVADGIAAAARMIVRCAGCGEEYLHIEGIHDGFCGPCEDTYTEQARRELHGEWTPIYDEDLIGFDDARVELDQIAVDEWEAAERDGESMPQITVADANAEVAAMIAEAAERDERPTQDTDPGECKWCWQEALGDKPCPYHGERDEREAT